MIKKIVNNKSGFTLVEVVVAVAVFTIISVGIMGVITSSQRITDNRYEDRRTYEYAVGTMDNELKSATVAGPNVTDVDVNVTFEGGSTATVAAQKVVHSTYGGIGVVKTK